MKNKINVSLAGLPQTCRRFVDDTIAFANKRGISVLMSADRGVEIQEGSMANGFFTDENDTTLPLTLAVACGQPLEKWFPVFIHESSHMDQYLEGDPVWDGNKVKGYDAWDIVDLWMDGLIELNDNQLATYIGGARDLEFDCEKRTVEKIKKYNLPIDIPNYIKMSNAYVLFYNVMAITRKWYTLGNEPYNIQEIVNAMPNTFSIDFNNPPRKLIELMINKLFVGGKV